MITVRFSTPLNLTDSHPAPLSTFRKLVGNLHLPKATRGACLACEAVVSKAKDRADSPLCRALGREEA